MWFLAFINEGKGRIGPGRLIALSLPSYALLHNSIAVRMRTANISCRISKNIGGKRADTQSQEKNGGSVEVVKRIFSLFSTFFSCFRREKCSFTFYVTTAILCTDYKKRGVAFLHSFPSIFPFLYKIQKWF